MIRGAKAQTIRASVLSVARDAAGSNLLVCSLCFAMYRTEFVRCPLDGAKLDAYDGDPLVGRAVSTVSERYQIQHLIGGGGTGRVYRAIAGTTGEAVAIKVPFGETIADRAAKRRLLGEATAARRVRHPNVVPVVDVAEIAGVLFLVMEFAEGITLYDLIDAEGALQWRRAFDIARQICAGLSAVHAAGLVHRDLKGGNVIVRRERGREIARLADFGAHLDVRKQGDDRLTEGERVYGTPSWMSPEQAQGLAIDHRSDLFGVGLLLYMMLSAEPPFAGSVMEQHYQIATKPLPRIRERYQRVELPDRAEALIDSIVAYDVVDRVRRAEDLVAAIDHLLASED